MSTSPPTKTPPYVSFRTFWNFIEELHEHVACIAAHRGQDPGEQLLGAARSMILGQPDFDLAKSEWRPTL